jgi:hypothetical protein
MCVEMCGELLMIWWKRFVPPQSPVSTKEERPVVGIAGIRIASRTRINAKLGRSSPNDGGGSGVPHDGDAQEDRTGQGNQQLFSQGRHGGTPSKD